MVIVRKCSFCGKEYNQGYGMIYVQRSGSVLNFCSNKCKKSQLKLKRDPKKLKWSAKYERKIL